MAGIGRKPECCELVPCRRWPVDGSLGVRLGGESRREADLPLGKQLAWCAAKAVVVAGIVDDARGLEALRTGRGARGSTGNPEQGVALLDRVEVPERRRGLDAIADVAAGHRWEHNRHPVLPTTAS